MTKKQVYTRTTVSLAPLSVDEALEALLKTPPPPKNPSAERENEQRALSAEIAETLKGGKAKRAKKR